MELTDKREQKFRQTRERIIEGARESFYAYGYSRVSMDEIADRLGMSKKTLYQHFSGKEELLGVIVKEKHCQFECRLRPIIHAENLSFLEKMVLTAHVISKEFEQTPLNFIDDIRKNCPDIYRDVQEFKEHNIHKEFGLFVREGIDKGVFRDDIPVELIIYSYAAVMERLIRPEILSKLPLTPAQMYNTLTKVFFEGILSVPGRLEWAERDKKLVDATFLSEALAKVNKTEKA